MHVHLITVPKQKSWGILYHDNHPGHFHTGYVGYSRSGQEMKIGHNAIITADFKITGMSRGRSAANFEGHFRGHEEVEYTFGMQGMTQLVALIQSGEFPIMDGYISGTWTIAKQGESIFLKPHVVA